MGVDDLRLSLSLHRLLALRIPSVEDRRRESYDVTFFFVGAVFGIATSAAVACNPSVPWVRNEARAEMRESNVPLARSLSRSVSLGTFNECHRSTNSAGTVSCYDSRWGVQFPPFSTSMGPCSSPLTSL